MPQLVVHAHELKTLMTPVYGGGRSGYVTLIRITCGNLMQFLMLHNFNPYQIRPRFEEGRDRDADQCPRVQGGARQEHVQPAGRCDQMNKLKY